MRTSSKMYRPCWSWRLCRWRINKSFLPNSSRERGEATEKLAVGLLVKWVRAGFRLGRRHIGSSRQCSKGLAEALRLEPILYLASFLRTLTNASGSGYEVRYVAGISGMIQDDCVHSSFLRFHSRSAEVDSARYSYTGSICRS